MEDLEKKIKEEKEMYTALATQAHEQVLGEKTDSYKFGNQDISISDKINESFADTLTFAFTERVKLMDKIHTLNIPTEGVKGEDAVVKYFADVNEALGNNFYSKALKEDTENAKKQILSEISSTFSRYRDSDKLFEQLIQYGDHKALDNLKSSIINKSVEQIETGVALEVNKLQGQEKIEFANALANYNSDLGVQGDPINYMGNLPNALTEAATKKADKYFSASPQERFTNQYNGRTLQP